MGIEAVKKILEKYFSEELGEGASQDIAEEICQLEPKETDAIKCHVEMLPCTDYDGNPSHHAALLYEDEPKPSDKFVVVYGKSGKTKYRKLSDEEVTLYEANPDEVERALITQLEGEEGIC